MAIYNGDGSPNLFAGGVEADTANGDGGNDILSGGGGSDTLDGGDDDDELSSSEKSPLFNVPWRDVPYTAPLLDTGIEVDHLQGGSGDDKLFAGYGDDVDGGANGSRGDNLYISFLGASAGVVVDFHLATQVVGGGTIQNIENAAWVQGTNYADDIDAGFDVINNSEFGAVFGMGGNDRLRAGWSTILLDGGTGDDILDGRTGNYLLQALRGGDGDDTLYADLGSAKVFGGEGNDTIYANGLISGGGGNDVIVLPAWNPGWLVAGDAGDDDITGSPDWDNYISGGEGADVVRGGGSADRLASDVFSESSNYVDLGLDHDVLTAGAGDDFVTIGFGDDADGGTGTDTLWLSLAGSASGVTLNTQLLASGQPVAIGGGTIQNFENIEYLVGSAYGDTFNIATQAMWMLVSTGDGDDVVISNGSRLNLYMGEGNDLFYSGPVHDLFNGGPGTDTVDYGGAAAGLVVILGFGGEWHPDSGGDTLVYVENVVGTGFADTLTGNELANILAGSGGDDILTGNAGNDILDGGVGIDTMRGGANDDVYHVDNAGDLVEENAGAGTDEVRTSLASA
ncbi:MAG TPA: calcium-binding protein, partial [Allosphingosinicella sp.]